MTCSWRCARPSSASVSRATTSSAATPSVEQRRFRPARRADSSAPASTARRPRAACARRARRRRRSGSRWRRRSVPSASRATIDQVIAPTPSARCRPYACAARQLALEHARDVQRLAAGAVGDLVAAAGAVGDDDRVRRACASPAAGSARPSASRRRNARPRSRSCRPCRSSEVSISCGCGAGNQAQHVQDRRSPRRTPSGGNGRAAGSAAASGLKREREAAGLRLAREEFLEQQRLLARRSRALSPSPIASASSRRVSRHDGSSPTIGDAAPRRTAAARRAARAASRLRLVDHARWPGRCGRSNGGRRPCATSVHACSRPPSARAPRRCAFSLSKMPLKVSTNSTAALRRRAPAIVARALANSAGSCARQNVSRAPRGKRAPRRKAEQLLAQPARSPARGRAGWPATATRLTRMRA